MRRRSLGLARVTRGGDGHGRAVWPAFRALEAAVHAPSGVCDDVVNDQRRKEAIRDALTLIGLLSGVPVGALARPLRYLVDVADECAEPTGPVDVARGLVVGR